MPFPSFFLPHAKVCRASYKSFGKALQNYFHDVKINFHDVKIDFQTLKITFMCSLTILVDYLWSYSRQGLTWV